MAEAPGRIPSKEELNAAAVRAAEIGDLPAARKAFAAAVEQDKRNAGLHYNLAIVDEQLGAAEEAAAGLTTALRLKPQFVPAARRLSRLLARVRVGNPGALDPAGLKAAFSVPTIARQPIAEAALARIFFHAEPLTEVLARSRTGDPVAVARELVLKATNPGLSDPLLLVALAGGVVKSPSIERLLTAVRRVMLLEMSPARFDDRALSVLALALMTQGWNNDFAWAETAEEIAALDRLVINRSDLLAGGLPASRALLVKALYRPLSELIGDDIDPLACSGIRPKMLREIVSRRVGEDREQRAAARALRRLGPAVDPTSVKVAGQYSLSPYPRWTSLQVTEAGALKRAMTRFFAPERLAFMDGNFDVLIAGAGTGQQALQSSFAYGPKARMVALDLSATSLGYARRMADGYKLHNVEFVVGDILDADKLGRQFDIIECVGVLHHMADPWAGARKLLGLLKPQGILHLGLYSAVARRNIAALRSDPAFPWPGCSDSDARAYRHLLATRGEGEAGADLKTSRNFFALNEFRDLALHESEHPVTLAALEDFLRESKLAFHGFTLDTLTLRRFAEAYPANPWPGRLGDWAEFEEKAPRTFEGMYRVWCTRLG